MDTSWGCTAATRAAAFSILVAVGCRTSPKQQPDSGRPDAAALDGAGDSALDADAAPVTAPDASPSDGLPDTAVDGNDVSSATIGASGGSIAIGAATLVIPANALAADTLISATTLVSPAGSSVPFVSQLFDFEPSGLVFQTPAMLSIDTAMSQNAALVIVQWHPDTQTIVRLPSNTTAGVVTASLAHLSSYGAIDDSTDPCRSAQKSTKDCCQSTCTTFDQCTDLSGVQNCGGCGIECDSNEICCSTSSDGTAGPIVIEYSCEDVKANNDAFCGGCTPCPPGRHCCHGGCCRQDQVCSGDVCQCPPGQTDCNGVCCSGSCVNGQCCQTQSSGPSSSASVCATQFFCPCNNTCYPDVGTCNGSCQVTLGCFTNICGVATAGQCP
jgi:hypothetical protein